LIFDFFFFALLLKFILAFNFIFQSKFLLFCFSIWPSFFDWFFL
jgi:hypothetical protein